MREELAALAHEQWSGWMHYMWGKCRKRWNGDVVIPREYAANLLRQMNTSYADLSEHEKDSDRAEADRVLALIGSDHK